MLFMALAHAVHELKYCYLVMRQHGHNDFNTLNQGLTTAFTYISHRHSPNYVWLENLILQPATL